MYAGEVNIGPWKNEISELAQAPAPTSDDQPSSTLVLAAQRTNRPDILRRFKHHHGGWDITNRHYWAVKSWLLSCILVISLLIDLLNLIALEMLHSSYYWTVIIIFDFLETVSSCESRIHVK